MRGDQTKKGKGLSEAGEGGKIYREIQRRSSKGGLEEVFKKVNRQFREPRGKKSKGKKLRIESWGGKNKKATRTRNGEKGFTKETD